MDDPTTSIQDGSSPRPRPKSLMDLPAELRDKIYQFCFSEETMVVFAHPSSTVADSDPKHPTTTMPVASQYRTVYPGNHATLETSSNPEPSTRAVTDWATSRTGILYTSRRIYLEAVQHFYKSCTFFFENPNLSMEFLDSAGLHNLKHVNKIAVYYKEETHISLFKWRLMCHQIVKRLPQVKELTIWIASIIEVELSHLRSQAYEAALLEFAALQQIATLDVKKFVDPFDNSHDEDGQWHTVMSTNEYTIRGVKEMIRTGDHWALDRERIAFLYDHDQ